MYMPRASKKYEKVGEVNPKPKTLRHLKSRLYKNLMNKFESVYIYSLIMLSVWLGHHASCIQSVSHIP